VIAADAGHPLLSLHIGESVFDAKYVEFGHITLPSSALAVEDGALCFKKLSVSTPHGRLWRVGPTGVPMGSGDAVRHLSATETVTGLRIDVMLKSAQNKVFKTFHVNVWRGVCAVWLLFTSVCCAAGSDASQQCVLDF